MRILRRVFFSLGLSLKDTKIPHKPPSKACQFGSISWVTFLKSQSPFSLVLVIAPQLRRYILLFSRIEFQRKSLWILSMDFVIFEGSLMNCIIWLRMLLRVDLACQICFINHVKFLLQRELLGRMKGVDWDHITWINQLQRNTCYDL